MIADRIILIVGLVLFIAALLLPDTQPALSMVGGALIGWGGVGVLMRGPR